MDNDDTPDPSPHLRRWLDRVPSMMAYWDRHLRCRFANRAYATCFGASMGGQITGASMRDVLGAQLYALNEPFILGALRGQDQSFERLVAWPDGGHRHTLAQYAPDVVDGVVQGFIVTVTNVTQLKETEARLTAVIASLEEEARQRRSAELNLAVTLASIDAGFIATDAQGRVTQMNSVSERLTGWPAAEAAGQLLWHVFEREDRPDEVKAMNPVDLMVQRGITVDQVHHVVVVSRSGTRTPVEVKAALTQASDGSAQGLALVLRDMTQRLQAELDSNRLAAIVESSQDVIIGKTLDGRITSWNAAAEALLGYSSAEAIGQPVQMLIPADRLDEEMRILSNLARGVRVAPFETVRLTRDGRPIDVAISVSPIRDGFGRIAGASKILRDLTHAKRIEQTRQQVQRLEAENRQIQEANRLKSQFLANMSHELRTPLNSIIGFADLLHAGTVPAESPKQHEFLGHIARSGRHLLQLINDVLDLAKVESGKFEFFPEPMDLAGLVKDVREILGTALEAKQIRFSAQVDPALADLVLDPARLRQVLYNFLSNAIKFTPPGGTVQLRAQAEDGAHFRLEVEDTGVGIAPHQLRLLFSEFQQLDAGYGKQHAGTGLGLALTRSLVEAQGGSVGVRSVLGQGSVFHMRLNRVHGTDAAAHQVAATRRLLVVEDDPQAQALLVRTLSGVGFQVDAAASAVQAAQLAAAGRFNGLTLKLHLPDRPGLDLLASLRSGSPSHNMPVLGMTMPAGSGHAASFAIMDILNKPLRTEEIGAAMARLKRRDASVMVIDDDPLALDLMRATLAGIGLKAVCFNDSLQALSELDRHQPQAIVLDLVMPGFDGFAVLDALHRLPAWRSTPVYIWTSMVLSEQDYQALARSARSIIGKGGGDLTAMLQQLQRWQLVPG